MAVSRCWLLLLLGCTGTAELPDALAGTVSAAESSGELLTGVIYAAELSGEILLGVFPRSDASCADAGAELTPGDPNWNSDAVQQAGACSLIILAPFSGELSLTDATIVDATVTLNCAMDTGEWEYRDSSLYDEGYYYTGPWWQGSPDTFDLSLSGSKEDGYELSIDMDSYAGRFLYDLEDMENDPGAGVVSGVATGTYCDEMIAGF